MNLFMLFKLGGEIKLLLKLDKQIPFYIGSRLKSTNFTQQETESLLTFHAMVFIDYIRPDGAIAEKVGKIIHWRIF